MPLYFRPRFGWFVYAARRRTRPRRPLRSLNGWELAFAVTFMVLACVFLFGMPVLIPVAVAVAVVAWNLLHRAR